MIFGDSVELNKNAWYVKMLRLMWGTGWEKFNNLCPLFWSVVMSLLAFPAWLLVGPLLNTKKKFWIAVGKGAMNTIMTAWAMLGSLLIGGFLIFLLISPILIWLEGGIWDDWLFIIMILGLVILGVIVLVICLLSYFFVQDMKDQGYFRRDPDSTAGKVLEGTESVFKWIVTPIVWVLTPFKWIWTLLKLICAYLYYNFYKKNCPHINWK
jgi:hypothetical protein